MNDLLQDIRYSLRMMARNRAFTAVAILTLAIGIGTSTTVFSWIDAVLLRPLAGVAQADRLVAVETLAPNGEHVTTSYLDYIDFRDHLKLVSGITASRPEAFSVGQTDHAERIWGELVAGNFFSVLGVKPALGRVFLPAEYGDAANAYPIAVISNRLWRTHFQSDPTISGKTIRVNAQNLTIVGVAPADFHGSMAGEAFDIWIPYIEQPQLFGVGKWMLQDRKTRNMLITARLAPGVTTAQARAELEQLALRMAVADADTNEGLSASMAPLSQSHFGPQALLGAPLRILMGACFVVLLIACVNVANLLLARASARQKEFSTRLALGANRRRLAQQVLTETLMLAIASGLAGLAATSWMSHSLESLLPPGQVPLTLDLHLNGHVLLFTIGLCALAAVLAGTVPALQSGRSTLSEGLNETGRSGMTSTHTHRLRSLLVASEVSLALVALICAGLFARGFQAVRQINPGFDPNHVLLSQFYLSTSGYNLDQRKAFTERLRENVESAPGVVNVAYSDGVPLGFEPSWWEDLQIQGYVPTTSENMKIFRNVVSPGYFAMMRIPLLSGRDFTEHDDVKTNPVMIVNQAFVRRLFAGHNPIGYQVHGWGKWFTIVGVAQDSKYHYLSESSVPYFYVPFRQIYRADMALAFYVRTNGDPNAILSTVREKVKEIDPNVTVFDAVPLAEFIGASLYPQKVAASLLSALGILAVLLSAIGLYSVMAYSVVQRTHEIGIRMALGALPKDVKTLVVRQGLSMTFLGLAAGVALALFASRTIASITFTGSAMGNGAKLLGVSATDPIIYLAAAVLLTAISAIAAYIPARRAASVEPVIALRYE